MMHIIMWLQKDLNKSALRGISWHWCPIYFWSIIKIIAKEKESSSFANYTVANNILNKPLIMELCHNAGFPLSKAKYSIQWRRNRHTRQLIITTPTVKRLTNILLNSIGCHLKDKIQDIQLIFNYRRKKEIII